MYVRLERRPDGTIPVDRETTLARDHQVLAGSFYLADAPLNELVHDSFGVKTTKGAPGLWDVSIGFGHFATPPVRGDLVNIGTFVVH